MSRPRRWATLGFTVGAALVLFAAYGPVLTRGPYGINDDYQYLYRTHVGSFDPRHNELVGMGRPVMAWGVQIAYGLCAGKVASLVWLRVVALVGVGVFAWLLCLVLVGAGYGRGNALTVAALVALTPACGVYAAWAAGMFAPWAACASLAAGGLLAGRVVSWRRDLVAGGLVVLACASWQAAVPLAMFPVLAAAWVRTEQPRALPPAACPWWRPWLVSGLAVGIYGVSCGLVARSGTASADGVSRLSLAVDPAAKARFLVVILRSGVTSWARLKGEGWQWAVGAGTVAACLLALPAWRDGWWQPWATARRAGLAVCMVLVGVAPLLAVREDNGTFRALICLYVAVTFLAVVGLRQLLIHASGWTRSFLAVMAVMASVGAARYHVWHGLVEPNLREYVGVRDEACRLFHDGLPPRLVYLVPPYTPLATEQAPASWEYGLVSSSFWWVTRPFLLVLLADALPGRAVPADEPIFYREAGNPGVPVLQSLPAILRDPGEWRDDPRWGRVRAFRDGWLYSPWFGYLDVRWFPYIQHHLLGGLLFSSRESDGHDLWFYHEGTGHFRTGAGEYPHLFLAATGRWVTPSDDLPPQVSLSDDTTHERLPYQP